MKPTKPLLHLLLLPLLLSCSDAPAEPPPPASSPTSAQFSATEDGFQIDLWLGDDVQAAPMLPLRRALIAGAEKWEGILAPSDPWDVHSGNIFCMIDEERYRWIPGGLIDDLAVIVVAEDVDGAGGVIASAGPCVTRYRGFLPPWTTLPMDFMPVLGIMIFDRADVLVSTAGELEDTVIHELGHVLGLGSAGWATMRLLHEPATRFSATYQDTYFSGANAIRAFLAAGGDTYPWNIVPVENSGISGSTNGHWRESVMQREMMTPYSSPGRDPISAITLGSLVDLGYSVDWSKADRYVLPTGSPDMDMGEREPHHDILEIPLMTVDRAGTVQTLPGPVR